MFEKLRPLTFGFALLSAVVVSSGCDQVRKLTDRFTKSGQAKPAFTATYSPDQVAALDSLGYNAFVSQKNKLLVVDYHADWCGPCKQLGPVLEKAALAHPAVVFVGKVNVDQAKDLATAQQIRSIPDVRIFKDGRQVDQFVGFPGEAAVLEKIAALAEGVTPDAPAAKPAKSNEPVLQPMKKDWMPPGVRKR